MNCEHMKGIWTGLTDKHGRRVNEGSVIVSPSGREGVVYYNPKAAAFQIEGGADGITCMVCAITSGFGICNFEVKP